MAGHNELGKLGEELAADYLLKHGYTILHRNWVYQKAEVDIIALPDHVLACGRSMLFGRHVPERLHHRPQTEHVPQPLGRLGLLEAGEYMPDLAQLADILRPHPQGDTSRRPEEVAEYRHGVSFGFVE